MKEKVFIAAALVLLSIASILFYSSEQTKIRAAVENSEIIDHFRSLQLIDRAIEKDLLLLHAGQIKNYDSIARLQSLQRKELAYITNATAESFNNNHPLIVANINAYSTSQKSTLPLIDHYKSSTAVLKNSLNYVNYLGEETSNRLISPQHDALKADISHLMTLLVQHLNSDTDQSLKSLNTLLQKLKQRLHNDDHPEKSQFEKLYKHITLILAGKKATYTSLNKILSSPHTDMLEETLQQYLKLQQATLQKHQRHSYATIFLMLLIAAVILYSAYRLFMDTDKLLAEKETLTTEVQESRESLELSNTELKREIEQRIQAEEELRDAAILYQNCNEGVVICDSDKKAISINPAFSIITGISANKVIGTIPRIFDQSEIPKNIYDDMMHTITVTGKWSGEVDTRNIDGRSAKEVSVITLKKELQIHRYIIILTDISERKKQEETIYFQANYDHLTELPNRNLFNERAEQTLARARRNSSKFATLFIDLDNFKKVNDNLGHAIGDELLIELASRLNSVARETDTVSRYGGDEFIILLDNIKYKHDLKNVLEKLIECINTPVDTTAETLHISGSIGISVYPDDGHEMPALIRCADLAMYKAKAQGKNTFCFFEDKMNTEIHDYHIMENQLRKAIANEELFLEYQPILDAKTQAIYATEALVRWARVEGNVPPDKFIPIAEESGLIIPIGEWIFRAACQQLANWNERFNDRLKMSINVSSLQFKNPRFSEMVKTIISETGANPSNLNIEITENLFLEGGDSHILTTMQDIRSQGISISLDDFGTGYSSLSYLKHFPVNTLKIDRTFVKDVTCDANDQSLIKAIINLAESLNMKVVAEGVETLAQYELLSEYHCDYIQGYYFSKPKSAEQLQGDLLSQ